MKKVIQYLAYGSLFGVVLAWVLLNSVNWYPKAASSAADRAFLMFDVVTYISAIIFGWVFVAAVDALWRFRRKGYSDMRDGSNAHGSTKLEIAWTLLPTAIVIGLGIYGVAVLSRNDTVAKAANGKAPVDMSVWAYSYAFDFVYPHDGNFVSGILMLPDDRSIIMRVRAYKTNAPGDLNVIHGFWIPEWSTKQDATPGIEAKGLATVHFDHLKPKIAEPTSGSYAQKLAVYMKPENRYTVQCHVLCGEGHTKMTGTAIVLPGDLYDIWIAKARAKDSPFQLFKAR